MVLLHLRKTDYITHNVYITEFLFSFLKGVYNTCTIHTQVYPQARVARIRFAGLFEIFSTSINNILLLAQKNKLIKKYQQTQTQLMNHKTIQTPHSQQHK